MTHALCGVSVPGCPQCSAASHGPVCLLVPSSEPKHLCCAPGQGSGTAPASQTWGWWRTLSFKEWEGLLLEGGQRQEAQILEACGCGSPLGGHPGCFWEGSGEVSLPRATSDPAPASPTGFVVRKKFLLKEVSFAQ